MPVTFPAHQAGVLPLKVWKPKWFDGLALVVGAGSPDLFLTLNHNPRFDAHGVTGVVVAVAFTIVYATLFRRYSADGLFGSLPDFGPLRCSSYRVLRVGRPRLLVTTFSAFVGVLTGLVWGWPSSPFPIFHMGLGLALSLFIAGAVNGQRTTRSKANGLALRRKSASEQAA